MPTANRRPFVAQAIRCLLAQDYAGKELVIVDNGADAVADLVPKDERIRYFRQERGGRSARSATSAASNPRRDQRLPKSPLP